MSLINSNILHNMLFANFYFLININSSESDNYRKNKYNLFDIREFDLWSPERIGFDQLMS